MNHEYITIVSGLPRSGTSLMMQMLQAGGLPVLSDGLRAADENIGALGAFWLAARASCAANWLAVRFIGE